MAIIVSHDGLQAIESSVMVITAFCAGEQAAQRCRAVALVGGAVGLEAINSNFFRSMHVPSGLGIERRDVACSTLGFAVEQGSPSERRFGDKVCSGRFWGGNRELIKMKRRELGSD